MDEILDEFESNWKYRKITKSLKTEIRNFIESRITNKYTVNADIDTNGNIVVSISDLKFEFKK